MFDLKIIQNVYDEMEHKIEIARKKIKRPMTLTEKILYSHLYDQDKLKKYEKSKSYVDFTPDRVAMQDATAQMALLQFMMAGKSKVAIPTTVHCAHLIQAKEKAKNDNSCTGIRLYVEKENKVAQSVYKKLGMDETYYKLFEVDFQN